MRSARAGAVITVSLIVLLPSVASATALAKHHHAAAGGGRLSASRIDRDSKGHGEKSEPTPSATPSATATATPFDAEGTCTNILNGSGTSQIPLLFAPVLNGHLFFREQIGDGDLALTPATSCPADAYTLTAYASRADYFAGAPPLGQLTKAGDGSPTLNFDVPLSSATALSVCVVGTNGLLGTTTAVPSTEPSPTTVERAPLLGCVDVADGSLPGNSFH
ncbi:MAG: hypothetical protein NVSMB55_25670 [Mycobacteriales bacterium]